VTDPQAAQLLARELQHELARPLGVGGQEITVSVSVAVIMLPTDATTAERALQIAGMVLSRAKEDGRAAIRFFEPGMDARLQARKALERDLARAIENQEFEVFYQPKMNVRTRELSGVEALIRWRHPEQGLIAPGLFIPVAEETRMITAIGRWVLEQACRDASHWRGPGRRQPVAGPVHRRQPAGDRRQRDSALQPAARPARGRDHRGRAAGQQRPLERDDEPVRRDGRPSSHGRFRYRLLVHELFDQVPLQQDQD
jgi:hypothetical protein